MKKKTLLLLALLLVFALSGCFGKYRENYRTYNRTIGIYDLYYKDLSDYEACPNEADHLYTLYSTDGNTFKYKGIRSGDGCYVELLADTGSGFTSLANLLNKGDITVAQLEEVSWTFDFVIIQEPDYEVGTTNYIEYFEEIGDYDVFIIDYGNTLCHNGGTVNLFEYNGIEYDVQGAPSGDGCISEYFIYYEEESDDAEDAEDTVVWELMTVNKALQEGHISIAEINSATYESDIFQTYVQPQILATEATVYFVNGAEVYNQSNPYSLSNDERGMITSILATMKYQFIAEEHSDTTVYITLKDDQINEYEYQIYDPAIGESTETVIAILTLTDSVDTDYTYNLYMTGIQIIDDELIVYSDYLNQTYILDLLEQLDE